MIMPAATATTAAQARIKRMPHGGFDLRGGFDKSQWVEYGSNARSYFYIRKSHIYPSVLLTIGLMLWFPIVQGNSLTGLSAALGAFA